MLRRLHSIPGLVAALLVTFMAITGAVLSVQPLFQQLGTPRAAASLTVAELTSRVVAQLPQTESISRSASGAITAHAGNSQVRIDPATGQSLGPIDVSPIFTFFTELHRSLFLGEGGRIVAGLAAAAMAVLAVSGALLLVKRMGGWRHLLQAARGTTSQKLHVELSRLAVAGLLLSAITGIYMTLATFGVISDGSTGFGFPPVGTGATPAPIAQLAALEAVPLRDLRELVLPVAGDPSDVFTLTTNAGSGYVDQSTGELIDFTANSPMQALYEAVYTLHTGEGVWWLALLLGMASLAVPTLMVTGTIIWYRRRSSRPRFAGTTGWRQADTVILVGSEGNTTWGFAATLQAALTANGHAVHVDTMDSLRTHYPAARQLLVLTATYGNGVAPATAHRFLDRLRGFNGHGLRYAVLGFGDRKFQHFCQFAGKVEAAVADKSSLNQLVPFATVDRQSTQAFAQWGRDLGAALEEPLELVHQPVQPSTRAYTLVDREDFGIEVQAPITVLRFAIPRENGWFRRHFARNGFTAGDLMGIVPPGDPIPRYYSAASRTKDGFLEIAVRKQAGGRCSEFLFGLEPGDTVDAFIRKNPDFRPPAGRRPLILIGAGTGAAPLAGFVRANASGRPIHLFFGGRDPRSDFLYGEELIDALSEGRLTRLITAFSRVVGGRYVQDQVRADAATVQKLLKDGASVMVCGGAAMAEGVREAFDAILAPLGQSVEGLRTRHRYLEDVY